MELADLDHFASALRLLRAKAGLQQKDVAQRSGMTRSQVCRYERGHDLPNLLTLVRYLVAIGSDFRDVQFALEQVLSGQDCGESPDPDSLWDGFEQAAGRHLPHPFFQLELLKPLFREVAGLKQAVQCLQRIERGNDD